jgi:nitrate/nitrite transporter NarK
MKNISGLMTVRILLGIAFVIQLIGLCFGNRFGENQLTLVRIISAVLLLLAFIAMFVFGNKIEQEKIEREQRRQRK